MDEKELLEILKENELFGYKKDDDKQCEKNSVIEKTVLADGTEKIRRKISSANIALSAKKRMAEGGDGEAQLMMGVAYADGENGLKQDFEKAFYWFEKSADNGIVDAQWQLGLLYFEGEGTPRDDDKGLYWVRKAAENGQMEAQNQMGLFYGTGYDFLEKDELEALRWYRKAADQGYDVAQYNLGNVYCFGYGVEEDMSLAVEWWQKSAQQGYSGAQYQLGLYNYINKEFIKAFQLFMKSAEQGFAESQYMVALFYDQGYGVDKDDGKALQWAIKSAEQGNNAGQCMLGQKYFRNEDKFLEGVYWLLKSVEQGNEIAEKFLKDNGKEIYSAGVRFENSGEAKGAEICFAMARELGYVPPPDKSNHVVAFVVIVFIVCVIIKFLV